MMSMLKKWHKSTWRITTQILAGSHKRGTTTSLASIGFAGLREERAATAILARQIPLVVAGRLISSIGNTQSASLPDNLSHIYGFLAVSRSVPKALKALTNTKYVVIFGKIFSRNSINNALMTVEVPCLVEKLWGVFSSITKHHGTRHDIREPSQNREFLDSPPPEAQAPPQMEKALTRRTGWHFFGV